MDSLFLIVGLGNPGAEYAETRHNVGFMAAERVAGQFKASWSLENKFKARVARFEAGDRKAILAEPQTWMNSSGEAVLALSQFFKAPAERVLILVDDADLPFGQIRMRPNGSSGGHHGLESVESHLGTREYARLRIGIGRTSDGVREIKGYVLGRFSRAEREWLDLILERVSKQVQTWLAAGAQKAMNEFNGAVGAPPKKEAK